MTVAMLDGVTYLSDPDVTLYQGDALDVLPALPDCSVHMAATSPPFYGLRDYGTGEEQIGLEATPDEWAARLVQVFREVRRVLRDDGTLWVEVGDSYAARGLTGGMNSLSREYQAIGTMGWRSAPPGMKPKDLIGAPWLLAFALRADGWYLRSEIIWSRPNPMPESVRDRPTKAHSSVFLLGKSARYYYDQEAIREPSEGRAHPRFGANARTVWAIPTEPTPFAHYATWPQKLVRRMILAGTSERGVCSQCGAPWVRETTATYDTQGRTTNGPRSVERRHESPGRDVRAVKLVETLGWRPSCQHDAPSVPAVVLDPFCGSGTTCLVARKLGRRSIGIDLNPAYLEIAAERLGQQSLFAEGVKVEPDGQLRVL